METSYDIERLAYDRIDERTTIARRRPRITSDRRTIRRRLRRR